jgi:hypothetical protein
MRTSAKKHISILSSVCRMLCRVTCSLESHSFGSNPSQSSMGVCTMSFPAAGMLP